MPKKKVNEDRSERELISELEKLRLEVAELKEERIQRKQIEEVLLESEEKFRTLIEQSHDAIYLLYNDKFEIINSRFVKLFGYTLEECQKRSFNFRKLVAPESMPIIESRLRRLRRGEPLEAVYKFTAITKNNREIECEVSTSYIDYKSGTAVQGIIRDISERNRAEEALQSSEARLKALSEASFEAIFLSEKGVCLDQNQTAERIFGYTNEEAIGKQGTEWIIPEDREQVKNHMLSGYEKPYEVTALKKDGTTFPCEIQGRIINYQSRSIRITALRDITERKKAEKMLIEERDRANNILEGTNAGTWDWNIQTGELILNERWAEIMGYTLKELEPIDIQTWIKNVHPDDYSMAEVLLEKHLSGNRDYYDVEFRQPHKDGNWVWVNARGKLIEWTKDGKPLQMSGTHLDITERKQAEEKALRFNRVLENSLNEIYLFDIDSLKFIEVNRGARENLGYTMNELCMLTPLDLKPEITAESFDKLVEPLRAGKQEKIEFFTIHRRKDGTLYPVEVHLQIITDSIQVFIAIIIDITERLKAREDRKKLEEQLKQAQKMEAIGTLAGGIAHDFNNILGIIMGYTELTLDDLTDMKVVISNLQRVMRASERAKDMVQQILAFSRKSEHIMGPINVGEVINEVITLLRSSIPTTIEIKHNIEKYLGLINGNATQVNQVLINLCTNASYAMKDGGGVLDIGLKEVVLDKKSSVLIDLDPGSYLHLIVSDTGTGISKDIIDRIFEPYFTTKQVDEGTGMGLAVIYGIIKSHRGAIKVTSEPGKGTVFNVYFPVLDLKKEEVSVDKE